MKQQETSYPSKANSTTNDVNNSKKEEISNIEFQNNSKNINYELKEETQKLVSDLKEDMNKQLNKLKQNTNR
jgi:hypothetical protein